jgi:hypothetical protein
MRRYATLLGVANTTLIAAVTGIGVSGVVGPMATAWATRRANRQQFERDQAAKRRADLQALIDVAAELLGAGGLGGLSPVRNPRELDSLN